MDFGRFKAAGISSGSVDDKENEHRSTEPSIGSLEDYRKGHEEDLIKLGEGSIPGCSIAFCAPAIGTRWRVGQRSRRASSDSEKKIDNDQNRMAQSPLAGSDESAEVERAAL